MTTKIRQKVYEKYNGLCAYTGKPLGDDWQVDHIVPKRAGGSDDLDNLLPALRIVNHYKRGKNLQSFRLYMLTFDWRFRKLPEKTNSYKTKKKIEYLTHIAEAFDITEKLFAGKFYFENKKTT